MQGGTTKRHNVAVWLRFIPHKSQNLRNLSLVKLQRKTLMEYKAHLESYDGHVINTTCISFLVECIEVFAG